MMSMVRVVMVMILFGSEFHRFEYFAHGGKENASRKICSENSAAFSDWKFTAQGCGFCIIIASKL
jgi:hypothetical protein